MDYSSLKNLQGKNMEIKNHKNYEEFIKYLQLEVSLNQGIYLFEKEDLRGYLTELKREKTQTPEDQSYNTRSINALKDLMNMKFGNVSINDYPVKAKTTRLAIREYFND